MKPTHSTQSVLVAGLFAAIAIHVAIIAVALVPEPTPPQPAVKWLGSVVYVNMIPARPIPPHLWVIDEKTGKRQTNYPASLGLLNSTEEIGLRDDGVVVWRPATNPTNTHAQNRIPIPAGQLDP